MRAGAVTCQSDSSHSVHPNPARSPSGSRCHWTRPGHGGRSKSPITPVHTPVYRVLIDGDHAYMLPSNQAIPPAPSLSPSLAPSTHTTIRLPLEYSSTLTSTRTLRASTALLFALWPGKLRACGLRSQAGSGWPAAPICSAASRHGHRGHLHGHGAGQRGGRTVPRLGR